MRENQVTGAQLTREAGLTSGLISQWKKGAQKPSLKSLRKVADYFHVSVDYLARGEKAPERLRAEEEKIDGQLKEINFALSGEVHELTLSEKRDVLNFIKFVKAQRRMAQKEGDPSDGQA